MRCQVVDTDRQDIPGGGSGVIGDDVKGLDFDLSDRSVYRSDDLRRVDGRRCGVDLSFQ